MRRHVRHYPTNPKSLGLPKGPGGQESAGPTQARHEMKQKRRTVVSQLLAKMKMRCIEKKRLVGIKKKQERKKIEKAKAHSKRGT